MKRFSVYEKATGLFTGQRFATDHNSPDVLADNTPPGCELLEGTYDHESQRLDLVTMQIVDAIPAAPGLDHEWDAATRRWMLKPDVAAQQRSRRNAQSQIEQLEARQARPLRELAINSGDTVAMARLNSLDEQIRLLRTELS